MPDGRVFLAGGDGEDAIRTTLFSPSRPYVNPFSGLKQVPAPWDHVVGALTDGRLLFIGAPGPQLVDPFAGTRTATRGLATELSRTTLLPLPDGGALALGGEYNDPTGTVNQVLFDQVQRLDSTTGTWTLVGHLATPRQSGAVALRLADGRIFITGGAYGASSPWAEIFQPATGTSQSVSAPSTWPAGVFPSCVSLLPDGRVAVGGSSGLSILDPTTRTWDARLLVSGNWVSFVQSLSATTVLLDGTHQLVLDLVTGSVTPAHPGVDWIEHLLPLQDGRFLLTGAINLGYMDSPWAMALYDPATGNGQLLQLPRSRVIALGQAPDGRVVVYTDYNGGCTEILDLSQMVP
jgi:hypothetical protein